MRPGPFIIVSGPSGCGKTTLIREVLAEKRWPLRHSVSVTTRPKRPLELPGESYYFWTREQFLMEVANQGFLEWAEVFGNYYGTLASEVVPFRQQGIGVITDIDVKGWAQVRQRVPDAISIFVNTSSFEILEHRLRARRTEPEEVIQRRLQVARDEIARMSEYQYVLVNDELDTAVAQLRELIRSFFEGSDHAR